MKRFWFGRAAACALVVFSALAASADAAINTGSAIIIGRNSAAASLPGSYDPNSKTQHGTPGGEFWVRNLDSYISTAVSSVSPGSAINPAHPAGVQPTGGTPQTSLSNSFKTFCLEMNEYLVLNGRYFVTIDDFAMAGGVSFLPDGSAYVPNADVDGNTANESYDPALAPAGGDPLSNGTKWLYEQYLDGTLDTAVLGYVYNNVLLNDNLGSMAARALQEAIWKLESESSTLSSTLATNLFNAAVSAATVGDNGVRVMNLWTTRSLLGGKFVYSGLAQSQLFMDSTQGGQGDVPEPASFFIWTAIGALGLVAVRRRVG